jgi:sortase A
MRCLRAGRPPDRGSSRPLRLLVVLTLAAAPIVAACGDAGDGGSTVEAAAELPAEDVLTSAADPTVPITEPTPATPPPTTRPSTTPSTLPAPSTLATTLATSLATTVPPTTAAPTVVETLPQPQAPPEPRAPEPRIELGTITIPKVGLDEPLLQGISLTVLDQGPGHWPGTAEPGRLGNVVVAGHRTSHGKEFRNLDQLVAGDEVIFTTAAGTFTYLVREITIVQPDAMYIIEQTEAYTATLFACHPPGSTRQRIVVHLDLATEQPPA